MPAELGPEFAEFEKNYQESLKTKKPEGASLSGEAPKYSHAPVRSRGMEGSERPRRQAQRQMTPEEMSAMADQMMAAHHAQAAAQLAAGPAVNPSQQPGGPPAWLQNYMASQPSGDPYKPIPQPINMTEEEKDRYGARRPF